LLRLHPAIVTDALALSSLPELKTFRTTLMRWRREMLAYFLCRRTKAASRASTARQSS